MSTTTIQVHPEVGFGAPDVVVDDPGTTRLIGIAIELDRLEFSALGEFPRPGADLMHARMRALHSAAARSVWACVTARLQAHPAGSRVRAGAHLYRWDACRQDVTWARAT